jgi:hypothetical protein
MVKRITQTMLVSVLAIFACTHLTLTPKQTVLWGVQVYNAQYDSYLKQAERDDLSEDEKDMLRLKKDILDDLHEVISLARTSMDLGNTPSDELRDDLIYLINRLVEEN